MKLSNKVRNFDLLKDLLDSAIQSIDHLQSESISRGELMTAIKVRKLSTASSRSSESLSNYVKLSSNNNLKSTISSSLDISKFLEDNSRIYSKIMKLLLK